MMNNNDKIKEAFDTLSKVKDIAQDTIDFADLYLNVSKEDYLGAASFYEGYKTGYHSRDPLVQAQGEYIKLLENHCSALTHFASIHGVKPEQIEIADGERLRAEIARLKEGK